MYSIWRVLCEYTCVPHDLAMHESAALSCPCLCVYGIWPSGACILQMLVNVCHAISGLFSCLVLPQGFVRISQMLVNVCHAIYGLLSCLVLPQGFVRILQMLVTACHAVSGLLSYDLVAMFLWQLECYSMILLHFFMAT